MSSFRSGGFQVLPPVVKNIIIINVLMAILQFVLIRRGIDLSDYLGLHHWKSELFRPWQYVTYLFMHGSPYSVQATVEHLFSNMFALWMFGSFLENIWGPKRFLTYYLVCGLGAAFCHLAVLSYEFHIIEQNVQAFYQNHDADLFGKLLQQNGWQESTELQKLSAQWQADPSNDAFFSKAVGQIQRQLYSLDRGVFNQTAVGASGSVFGILLAFGYLFPNMLIYFLFAIPIKAKWFVILYGVFELYSGIRANPEDNVAHFAHLGGMLFGFLLLRVWRMRPNHYA